MSAENSTNSSSQNRSRTLGICWIVYGIIRLVMALWLFLFNGTATVMFGALLNRVPNPFALMDDFHIVYVALIALSALCGVLGILGGLASMGSEQGGRKILLIAAFLSVSEIPLGTTLGIYTLVTLLPMRARSANERA
jgi:hypothetical protein